MDIKQEIKAFLTKHQTTGWLILLMVGGLVLQGIILIIMAGLGVKDLYQPLIDKLVLPYSFTDWFTQPWSIFTYPFFATKIDIFRILVNGLIIWAFGRIHQQLLTNIRTWRLVILTIPIIGLLTITFSSIVNFEGTTKDPLEITFSDEPPNSDVENLETYQEEEKALDAEERRRFNEDEDTSRESIIVGISSLLRVSGFMPVIMVLVISSITLVPHYPIQLFLFGQVKIMWIGIALLAIELLWATFFTPFAIAIAIGALLGYLHIYFLRDGTDITEIVWSYYQDSRSKPKMTVKYGDKKKEKKGKTSSQSSVIDTKGVISQDLIDKILYKINAKGYESLSREEKELLFKASQKDDER